ncbi:MAG: M1 family metallopeptidase [Flavobacteriales bacterium]|nr:M1 family metallopeptidase [Flavobacteriales bacterium]
MLKLRLKIILPFLLFFSTIALSQNKTNPYFQQHVEYNISVTLNDNLHELNANQTIKYTNNSPDKLELIYFHLWPNGYKSYKSALSKQKLESGSTDLYFAKQEELGFIDGLNFTSSNKKLEWEYVYPDEDICRIYLPEALLPGETIEISTPFRVKIPVGKFSRLGHIGQSYQITQWYPKPAVYDRDGWHAMPYLDQGEFYSEYGTFDVKITLPKNYVVGSTGDIVDGEDEINWLNQKVDSTRRITDFVSTDLSFPESSSSLKTLHFHQEKVHDFAWFADKRYHVLKGEVELPHSKEKVTTWAMFTNNEADLWKNSIDYLNDAIYYYSLWNGDYPYKQVTAVDGALSAGGGMEYPNVTVIGNSGNAFGLETVIMHEVGHNWFYGILGSNERLHPWMDEGINSLNENRYIETKYPNKKLFDLGKDSSVSGLSNFFDLTKYPHKCSYELMYLINAKRNLDQPIEEHSAEYTSLNYGGIVYSKTAIVFDYLKAYLGNDMFDNCMQEYFNRWKFKHPQPSDLRQVFEDVTNKDLGWFFDDIIKTTKKIDYKIISAKPDTSNPENILIKIKNKGGINGPFSISGIKDSQLKTTQWYEPIGKKAFVPFKKEEYDSYRIDAQLEIPEISRKNNTLKSSGLFKRMEPIRFQLIGSLENPDKTQLFFSPIVGWNSNDKFMLGTAIYNSVIPSKKFEYIISPMYAFGSEKVNGYASTFYHFYPNQIFQDINFGVKTASFSYLVFNKPNSGSIQPLKYYKLAPQINFEFKKARARQFHSYFASIENTNIYEEKARFYRTPDNTLKYELNLEQFYVNQLTLGVLSKNPINPYNASINIQQSEKFLKINIEANYKFAYKKKNSGLDIRFFIGRFLYNDKANTRFNYNLSGNSDYLYNHILLARNTINGFLNQQAMISDGGFKNYTTTSSSNKWLNAINLKTTLPARFIGLYADFGLTGYTTKNYKGDEVDEASDITYGFGTTLILFPDMFEIYFPIKLSSDLNQLKYMETVRFMLNLNLVKPFERIRNLQVN